MAKHLIMLPEEDANRRAVLAMMLGLSKSAANKLTVKELEDLCFNRGYLELRNDGSA